MIKETPPAILALLLTASLSLSACQTGEKPAAVSTQPPAASITVTADINTGIRTKHITVIPNDVAPWLSQIILLDTSGDLYRTALDSGKAKPLNAKAKDAIGLMRRKAPGVLLTLSDGGTLSAFIESNDEGDLSPLAVSSPNSTLSGFCHGEKAPDGTVYAITNDSHLVSLAVLVEDNQHIHLSETQSVKLNSQPLGCLGFKNEPLLRYEDKLSSPSNNNQGFPMNLDGTQQLALVSVEDSTTVLKPLGNNPNLGVFLTSKDEPFSISVQGGLSTEGLSQMNAAYMYVDSLGGVFRDGALILSDANSDRLVMISKPLVQRELASNLP